MNNDHAAHPLWKENHELAKALREKIEINHERETGHYNFGGAELGDAGISFIAHHIKPYDDVKSLSFSSSSLTDNAMADIVSIAQNSPKLTTLNLQNNAFTAKGARILADGLKDQPMLLNLDLRSNPLGESAGEALAEIASRPSLRHLFAMDCQLGDAGMRPLYDVIANSHTLEKIGLSGNNVSLEGCHEYIKAIKQNRSLVHSGFDQKQGAEVKEYLTKAYAEVRNPNLLEEYPVDQNNRPKLKQNKSDAAGLPPHLAGEIRDIPHATLKFIDARANAIFSLSGEFLIPNSNETRRETYTRYETFMRSLPKLPEKGADFIENLFKEDENGFTPLDNPRVNRSAGALQNGLEDVPLTKDLLTRNTTRGASILEAMAGAVDTAKLVKNLNAQGIKLGAEELLTSNGLPNETLHNIIEKDGGSALFTVDNWLGKNKTEMLKVYDAIPPAQQRNVGLHALQAQMRPVTEKGIGR